MPAAAASLADPPNWNASRPGWGTLAGGSRGAALPDAAMGAALPPAVDVAAAMSVPATAEETGEVVGGAEAALSAAAGEASGAAVVVANVSCKDSIPTGAAAAGPTQVHVGVPVAGAS